MARRIVSNVADLLSQCLFPPAGSLVNLAVSGGPDSVGMTLLAVEAGLIAHLHHVDHHVRPRSGQDAELVRRLAADLSLACTVHDVVLDGEGNFESRARAARRGVLPPDALTGHTMDDLAETQLLNLMRGAGLAGLSPMVGDPTKPLLRVRRSELRAYVEASGRPFAHDESNDDLALKRNAVRAQLVPVLNDLAERDVVPILARQAELMAGERQWLEEVASPDAAFGLGELSCRELATWPVARLRAWLRPHLTTADMGDGTHPPTAAEVERAIEVIRGECQATELSGGRRLSRHEQFLKLG